MDHVCNDACHRPGGPLTHDEHGHSIVNDEPMDALTIADERGRTIFRLRPDGTAELRDPNKAPLAAAIFWREVLEMARLLRVPVAIIEPEDAVGGWSCPEQTCELPDGHLDGAL